MHYVLIADLARQWLFENGEQTDHKFARANYFGTQGAKLLQLHLLRRPTPKRLPVRANKTVVLPAESTALLKVGLVRGSEVVELTPYQHLVRDRAADATGNPGTGDELRPLGLTGEQFLSWAGSDCEPPRCLSYGPQVYGNLAGHYLRDEAGGQLILAADVPADAQLYVEYLNSGIDPAGTAQVPLAAEQAVITYINWQMAEKRASTPQSEKVRLQEEHKRQMRLLQNFRRLTTKKSLLEALTGHDSRTTR